MGVQIGAEYTRFILTHFSFDWITCLVRFGSIADLNSGYQTISRLSGFRFKAEFRVCVRSRHCLSKFKRVIPAKNCRPRVLSQLNNSGLKNAFHRP